MMRAMKILHSADMHLRQVGDTRWRALEHLLDVADNEASLFVICGDLFDRGIDALQLKSALRERFHRCTFPIVILPGNHDAAALGEGDYYGDNVTLFRRFDRFVDFDDVRVFGLPFEKIEGDRVIEKLIWIGQHTRRDGVNILLYHGELLDMVHARDGFGNEDLATYMPVRLSYFDRRGIDYVLAGHFHTSFQVRKFHDGYFVYPGSPTSITRKETGVRKANLFEVGEQPMPLELDTAYFEEIVVRLDPLDGTDPVEAVRERVRNLPSNVRARVVVDGFVDLGSLRASERDLHKAIGALMTPEIEEIVQPWRDIGEILQSDLLQRCDDRLARMTLSGDRLERVRDLIIEGMMESHDAN